MKLLNLPDEVHALPLLHGFMDDCYGLPPRQYHTHIQTNLAAGADVAATVIFSPARAIYVHDVLITGDGSPAGVDDSNTSVWTIANGATTIVAETFDSTTAFPADNVQTSLGTLAANVSPAGGRIELTILNGATADPPPTVITIVYSDLGSYPSPNYEMILTDHGLLTLSDAVGGIYSLTPSDGTAGDNDEAYLIRTAESFKVVAGKPIICEALIQFTEASTDDANVLFGLMDAVAANHIQDGGAGPVSSYSGMVFFKSDGDTVWSVENSITTAQKTTQLTAANSLDGVAQTAGGASYQTLRIEIQPTGGTLMDVSYFIDGILVAKHKDQTVSSATDMQFVLGVKNGGANAETVLIDYLYCYQKR